jgi:hypothetical protein
MDTVTICLGRVVDILEASGAFDPGSNPGRGVTFFFIFLYLKKVLKSEHRFTFQCCYKELHTGFNVLYIQNLNR